MWAGSRGWGWGLWRGIGVRRWETKRVRMLEVRGSERNKKKVCRWKARSLDCGDWVSGDR